MVTQQILVLSFWVRVPAAQHNKRRLWASFVVYRHLRSFATGTLYLFAGCEYRLKVELSRPSQPRTILILLSQTVCANLCCREWRRGYRLSLLLLRLGDDDKQSLTFESRQLNTTKDVFGRLLLFTAIGLLVAVWQSHLRNT